MASASDATPKPIAAPAAVRRILVVDDNADAAESLAAILSLTGNETRAVNDGLQAISEAEAFRPDVMLVDIGMPRVSGHDVARTIRAKPWGSAPLLIALTGWTQESDRQRSHDAGFDLHLSKPVDPAMLQELIIRNTATG